MVLVAGQFAIRVSQTPTVTNTAADPDSPAQTLTFSLGHAPAGASIKADSGVFRWTPSCGQGNNTNTITLVVTDNFSPMPLSATTNITAVVRECVEASLGNTVMLAGSSNAVSIRLESNVELTNLFFTVVYAPERFTNFALHPNPNAVPAGLGTNLSAGQYFVSFDLPANRILRGPTNVGELSFSAVPDQPSAFVPLPVVNVDGRKPNGERVANAYGYPGRVTVVGREPLLEAALLTNGLVELTLYAPPGATVRLESADHLPATLADWMPLLTVSNQAVIQVLPPLPASGAMRFIRAVRP